MRAKSSLGAANARRVAVVVASLVIVLAQGVGLGPAGAVVATTYSGTLDDTDPTLRVVLLDTPECLDAQGTVDVHHDVIPLSDPVSGTHTFTVTPHTVSLYVYEGSFDPSSPLENCVAGVNDGDPKRLTVDLTGGTPYFVVVFDDTTTQEGADYVLIVEAPDPPTPTPSTEQPVPTEPSVIPLESTAALPAIAEAPAAPGSTRPLFTG